MLGQLVVGGVAHDDAGGRERLPGGEDGGQERAAGEGGGRPGGAEERGAWAVAGRSWCSEVLLGLSNTQKAQLNAGVVGGVAALAASGDGNSVTPQIGAAAKAAADFAAANHSLAYQAQQAGHGGTCMGSCLASDPETGHVRLGRDCGHVLQVPRRDGTGLRSQKRLATAGC